MNKLKSIVVPFISSMIIVSNSISGELASILLKKPTYNPGKEKEILDIESNFKEESKQKEVLGLKLYKSKGEFNKKIEKIIIKVGGELEKILPKGVKCKINGSKTMFYYKYKF